MMFRVPALVFTILFAALSPEITAPEETNIWRYAITQGGLLVVVLVLFWYIRQMHQARLDDKEEKLQVMISVVSEVKVALTRSVDSGATQAKSIEGLARAIERIEERRTNRSRHTE